MPSSTQYAQLWLYNNTTDRDQLFMDFRDNLAGTKVDSNMQKVDKLLSSANDRLITLESIPHTITVKAVATSSENNFIANDVSGFTNYKNNMILLIYLPKNNVGLTTININNTGVTSMTKIDATGSSSNLDANDLKKNIGYLFQYDGVRLILMGEKFESVITSSTKPINQFTGGIWNQTLDGGGIKAQVKQADGSYSEIPPQTKAVLTSFADGTTVESFKTSVLGYHSTNDTNIAEINKQITSLTSSKADLVNGKVPESQLPMIAVSKSIYVAESGSDATGDGSQSKPFQSIQKALDTIPKNLNGNVVTVYITRGTYSGFSLIGVHGGRITIQGINEKNAVKITSSIIISYNTGLIALYYLTFSGNLAKECITFGTTNVIDAEYLWFDTVVLPSNRNLIYASNGTHLFLTNTVFESCTGYSLVTSTIASIVALGSVTGTNNKSIALHASGGIIHKSPRTTVTATTAQAAQEGGVIFP